MLGCISKRYGQLAVIAERRPRAIGDWMCGAGGRRAVNTANRLD